MLRTPMHGTATGTFYSRASRVPTQGVPIPET